MLAFQLSDRLAFLETEYEYAEKSVPARPRSTDELIILFAGFDLDGKVWVAKVDIAVRATPRPNSSSLEFRGEVSAPTITPVGNDLIYLTSGVDESARHRLESPSAFQAELELKDYNEAVRHQDTTNLSMDQLER